MSFSPPSRFGPPGSLSDRQFGTVILSTSANRVRFGLVSTSIRGMSVEICTAAAMSALRGTAGEADEVPPTPLVTQCDHLLPVLEYFPILLLYHTAG